MLGIGGDGFEAGLVGATDEQPGADAGGEEQAAFANGEPDRVADGVEGLGACLSSTWVAALATTA